MLLLLILFYLTLKHYWPDATGTRSPFVKDSYFESHQTGSRRRTANTKKLLTKLKPSQLYLCPFII